MDIRIPGYEIVREARRGGQGVIFQALQKSTNRKVAVKVLLDGALADARTQERFRREVEIVAGLRHPYIVAAFDCGETEEGHPYFVMDFVYGQRLSEYVRDHHLAIPDILRLFAEICDGVNYAHQRGVIHRDLKPANVIVDAEGRPRVLDFGLARRVDGKAQTLTTMAGGVVGTLAYMSPEQVQGPSSEVDVRTDVYSLGVMLYETIAGTFPYAVDGELTAAFDNIRQAAPAPLTSQIDARERIPADLETIVRTALAKEPQRRYQNAGELGADLRHFLEGEPIDARRDSRMYVIKTMLRRHRWSVTAVATFVALLIAWGATLGVLYAREQQLTRQIKSETSETNKQRDRAIAAEAEATQRFDMVREMASDLLFKAHDRVANLAGATPARALVVRTALEYLEDLRQHADDDAGLQHEVAAGYMKLGDVQGGLGQSNLGDTPAALKSYQTARDICRTWRHKTPDDQQWQSQLARAEAKIGGLSLSENKLEEALEHYRAALATVQLLVVGDTGNPEYRAQLAGVLENIAKVQASRWKMKEARDRFEAAASIYTELASEFPGMLEYRRDVAMLQLRIVRVILTSEDNTGEAMPFVDKSISMLRDIVNKEPESAKYARDLSIALDHRVDLLVRLDRADEAIDVHRESDAICERLARLDPTNVQAQHDRLISQNDFGRMMLSVDRADEAMKAYQKGLELAESLSKRDPTSAIFRRDVGQCHDNLALAHAARAEPVEAISDFTKAIEVYEALRKEDADNFSVLRDLAIARDNRGRQRIIVAKDEDRPIEERWTAVNEARSDFEAYRRALIRLRDGGRLAEFELKYIDRADEKLATSARLRDELAKMKP